jgi:thioesterase domain-containing protein
VTDPASAPLVATHTWLGEDAAFDRLARAMDMSILRIPPPSPETLAGAPMPRRVEQWVDHHEAVLARLPVEPPYRLVGWSFGGVVAVELARRLRNRGAEVAFVGMIDSLRPILRPRSNRDFIWYHLAEAAAMTDGRARLPYLRRKAVILTNRKFPRAVGALRRAYAASGLRPTQPDLSDQRATDPLLVSIRTAYLNYEADPVPFPVSLYITERSAQRAGQPALRWLPMLHGGYELVTIPGGHRTLFDPGHVDHLAATLHHSLRHSLGHG